MKSVYRAVFEFADIQTLKQECYSQYVEQLSDQNIKFDPDLRVNAWCKEAIRASDIFLPVGSTKRENASSISTQKDNLVSPPCDLDGVSHSFKNLKLDKDYYNLHTSVDWRFSGIEVTALDMTEPTFEQEASAATASTTTSMSTGATTSAGPSSLSKRSLSFVERLEPLKSKLMGYGVIRLYRDSDGDDKSSGSKENTSINKLSPGDQTIIAILAVPSYLTASDFLGFAGDDARDNVSHFRMIRTAVPNRYMVLMKFRDPLVAKKFQKEYNGKLFNSMESERCNVVFISSIQFKSHPMRSSTEFPYLLEDPFTTEGNDLKEATSTDPNSSLPNRPRTTSFGDSPAGGLGLSSVGKPVPPPTPSLRELPTCPVCLERMDASITGLLTIPCQHTFHCQCLSKWADGSCPVCRYSNKALPISTSQISGGQQSPSFCNVCKASENLWVCLICGHVGCGRYDRAHAYDHFVATGHCFAMDISSQRVWDYASDGYVHRLIQNQSDGKLVELPCPDPDPEGSTTNIQKNKIEDIGLQYTYLLTSQLESQREYYEDIFASAADRAAEATDRADHAEQTISELESRLQELKATEDIEAKYEKTVAEFDKLAVEFDKMRLKSDKLQTLCRTFQQSVKEEQLMSQNILAKVNRLSEELRQRETENTELKEQVRDLMFFLDSQEKLKNADDDIQQGKVVIKPKRRR